MARIEIPLRVTYEPAFYAIVEVAELIADQEGTDRAMEWAERALKVDIDLFVRVEVDQRPKLTLVKGGLE